MSKKERKQVRIQARPRPALQPLRIEVTQEEILADLLYPASRRPLR